MHAWEQIQWTLDYIEEQLGEPLKIETLAKLGDAFAILLSTAFQRCVLRQISLKIR